MAVEKKGTRRRRTGELAARWKELTAKKEVTENGIY
jgi:hypothetical protein